MKDNRFLAIAGGGAAARWRSQNARAPHDLGVRFERQRLLLLAPKTAQLAVSHDGTSALVGRAFDRRSGAPVSRIEAGALVHGPTIGRHCWGHYVAFHCGEDDRPIRILRAPFGSLPCFYVKIEDGLLAGSDLGMLALTGWKPQGIVWEQVACQLLARDIPRSATCLTGMHELRGGDCLEFDRNGMRTAAFWSPWEAATADKRPRDRAQAAKRIRRAVSESIRCEVAAAERPLLMLSGGLDSSIVGASLALAGRSFACLNLVSADASGDERTYARLAAEAFGAPLQEAERQIGNVDLTVSKSAHLPRPAARGFVQDSTRLALAAARSAGCDLLVDGGGGDNVFCSLQSVAPVAEALRHAGSWREAWRAARGVAQLTGASVPNVLRGAIARAWLRPRGPRWPLDRDFLRGGLQDDVGDCLYHPWLSPDAGDRPGTASHIALLVAAQNWVESFDPQAPLPSSSPLLAQPIVEACLAVPSWWWFDDGLNRVVARRAFADLLPGAIVRRRSKASPDSFVAELFERNKPTIRAMLLGGRLAAEGLLDRVALERAFADRAPVRGTAYRRIMRLVDVEAWSRCWS